MKKINYRLLFLGLIAILLLLSGCKVDTNYTVDGFELKSDVYQKNYSVDTDVVSLDGIVQYNENSGTISYFYDEEQTMEVTDEVSLVDGDNYVYCSITYKGTDLVQLFTLNFYKLKMCTVTFDTKCNVKVESVVVEEGTIIDKPDVELERKGYAFEGWNYSFSKPISSDTTIEAKWKANSYTITYDANGGEVEFGNIIVTYGEPYELDTPVREGYIFKGWKYDGKLLTAKNWLIDENIVVVAEWEAELRTYEIEYIIVGATGANLQRTYTNKEHVILRTPYKSGYKFVGWYTDGKFQSERVYELPAGTEGNFTFYSKWEKFTLEGSKISFLGDSITTFYSENSEVNSLYSGHNQYYYPLYSNSVKTVDKTWWYKVVEGTKTTLVANDSWSGSSCYNYGNESNQGAMNYNRINNLKGSDIVVILIGTNDNVNGFTNNQFTSAYNTMLDRINEVCPGAFVFCCTMGYSAYKGYNYTEERRIEYNEIIRKCAENHDAAVIEISDVQTKDTYSKYLGDSLHPNAEGMIAYAEKTIEAIKNYVGA